MQAILYPCCDEIQTLLVKGTPGDEYIDNMIDTRLFLIYNLP